MPRDHEVCVRVYATTVTPSDVMLRSGRFPLPFWLPARILYGFMRPRNIIPSYEFAGEVEAAGKEVRLFRPGDRVFGATMWRMSCCVEYVCLAETAALAPSPSGLSHREAVALVDGPCTALHFLTKANVKRGQEVLVYGASGSVGSAAVQLAKRLGLVVTGLCSSANVDLVRSLGADEVIDYQKQDFSRTGRMYDLIFDAVGKAPLTACVRTLKPRGTYLSTVMSLPSNVRGRWVRLTTGKTIAGGFSISSAEKLRTVTGLVEKGGLRPVIDRVYPLAEVADAHQYVGQGHKKGSVVIDVRSSGVADRK